MVAGEHESDHARQLANDWLRCCRGIADAVTATITLRFERLRPQGKSVAAGFTGRCWIKARATGRASKSKTR